MGALGSDAAIEAADVVLMDDNPAKIALAMRISRKCLRIVYENIVFALAVKAICQILLDEGYIKDMKIEDDGLQGNIVLTLKYGENKTRIIQGLKRISKPGLRIYAGREDMPRVMKGLGVAIVSTSKGVMTDKQARKLGVGGEVLAFVW